MKKIEINVNEICKFAISEEKGLILRKNLEDNINTNDEVVVNFEGISMFTTPFFNASLGFLILKYGPDKFDEKVKVVGLEDMGKETYAHSRENAIEFYSNKIDPQKVGQIVSNNLTGN